MDTENIIKELVGRYKQSIDEASVTLAAEIWLNSPEVTFIHPKGHEHGFEEIAQNFIIGLFEKRFSARKLDIFDVSIQIYGPVAVVEFYWQFTATFVEDGSNLETEGRESQVYIKTNSSDWKLVHVHYSGMPVAGERSGF